jgi:hypothetical protein
MKIKNHHVYGIVIVSLLFGLAMAPGCESGETAFEQPEMEELEMQYTASEVADIRNKADLDQRALALDGVISIGVTGNSNEDAWIQILCKSDSAITHARTVLGDSLDGVPIKFAVSDTIRAQ